VACLAVDPGGSIQVGLRPDAEFRTAEQIEEGGSAVFEFAADDTVGRRAEAVAAKGKRAIKVRDAARDDGESALMFIPFRSPRRMRKP